MKKTLSIALVLLVLISSFSTLSVGASAYSGGKYPGHKSSLWITDKKATVHSAGSEHKECTKCGKILETRVVPQVKPWIIDAPTVKNTVKGIYIKWTTTAGADNYNVYRKSGDGEWTRIGSTKKNTFTDKTAKSGKTYSYVIAAENEAGETMPWHNTTGLVSTIKRLASPKLDSVKSTKSGVKFEWDKVSSAKGYTVYRKTGSGEWVQIGTIKSGKTVSYTDKTAKKGTTYRYTVSAYAGSVVSSKNATGLKVTDKY